MVLRPVGQRPSAVYWRRRVVLLVVLVVVVLLVVRSCSGGGAAPRATTSPSTGATPSTAPLCHNRDLALAVRPPAATLQAGEPVRFAAVVTSSAASTCELQVLATRVVWTVTQGQTTVFTTDACQAQAEAVQAVLAPGAGTKVRLRWDGHVSGSGCVREATAAAGQYDISLSLGNLDSAPVAFTLAASS